VALGAIVAGYQRVTLPDWWCIDKVYR